MEKLIIENNVKYKITLLSTEKTIPKEEEKKFKEWLKSRVYYFTEGIDYDYYSYNENYIDDILVKFKIDTI